MTNIEQVEGIGQIYTERLNANGINTVEALLKQGAFPAGRERIARETGIPETLILEWVNHADLWRINGVGEEYSDLLEVAGVDTVVELAQRNPHNLYEKLMEVNRYKKLVRRLPSEKQVSDWVSQAKMLPRVVTY